MGSPIRKSLDQSSFAAPQGLSQRTTSFIASQRQGIHRMLLRHLIAPVIDVRPDQHPLDADDVRRHDTGRKKTSDQAVSDPTAVCLPNMTVRETLSRLQQSHSLFTMSDIFAISSAIRDHRILEPLSSGKLFDHPDHALEGSTPRASPAPALNGRADKSQKNGGARRDRTDDLMLAKHALSQLSYGPMTRMPQPGRLLDNGGPGTTRTSDLTLIRGAL